MTAQSTFSSLVSTLRGHTTNFSSSYDPLDDIRRLGISESSWHCYVSEMILDDLVVNHERFFPVDIASNSHQFKHVSSYRGRKRIRHLFLSLCRLPLAPTSCRRTNVYLEWLLSSPTDASIDIYRKWVLFLQPVLRYSTPVLCLKRSINRVAGHMAEGEKQSCNDLLEKLPATTESRQWFLLFCEQLMQTVRIAERSRCSNGSMYSAVAFDSLIREVKMANPHFYNSCTSSPSFRQLFFSIILGLLEGLKKRIPPAAYHKIFFILLRHFSNPSAVAFASASSKLLVHDVDLYPRPLVSAACLLLTLDPFELPLNSFVWACQTILKSWDVQALLAAQYCHMEMLLLQALPWLHVSLLHLLSSRWSQPDYRHIVSFVTSLFVFSGIYCSSMLMTDEHQRRQHAFEGAFLNLANHLQQITRESVLQANRVLAPFRQFSSRCNLVAKVCCAEASTSTSSLHPIGQSLLCLFVTTCRSAQPLCPSVLDSLLAPEMSSPHDRFAALREAVDIVVKARESAGFTTDVVAESLSDCEIHAFLESLRKHYLTMPDKQL